MRYVASLSILVALGCSGGSDIRCDYDCFAGWWYSDIRPCGDLCDLSVEPPECDDPDCRMLSVRRYGEDGELIFLGTVYYSEEMRSFTRDVGLSERSWEIVGECEFASSTGEPMQFTCSDDTLRLSAAVLLRPSASLEAAFEAALTEGSTCQHSF